ncbi:bifunctional glutamate N-acetyltransferase/amino-acid acetyltransferase ArgJ [uncultured Desulfuromusa sp.]|uniref:bifunctional glutamate N-acetyltransferase/amino-acid acetyltransferase ArgJ n=1 Tax=uncultured Desulfuromusa sp. TaxID=219183 RepID=UPI002AA85C4D|nr:bifunctional glutamate N-acetyltransferase/amino-acid acetyltransferase ArgJ [uncultured Desulfuromusa sp.]
MNHIDIPSGFRFSGLASGIKKSGKLDLGLIVSDVPADCAGVFTQNKVIAAPLLLTKPRVARGKCQAILVNSGNANACTGAEGLRIAETTLGTLADELQIENDLVAVASTGVIGELLPLPPFVAGIPELVKDLSVAHAPVFAEAIMTTDAFPKVASAAESGKQQYKVLGVAKGAGMIHPNMATMLGFVLTDAFVSPELLDSALQQAVQNSFNSITVDGDTSTNDMVLLLANGSANSARIEPETQEAEIFCRHLENVLLELAKMIVRDGEGATKLVQIKVIGGTCVESARKVARSVATSSLVKTAFFGEDANWGRIIAAVGYSGVDVNPDHIDISFNQIPVAVDGLAVGGDSEAEASKVLKLDEFVVTIDLHQGGAESSYYTSDLSYEYVKINADYRT